MVNAYEQIKRYINQADSIGLKKILNDSQTLWPVKIVAWSVIKGSLDKSIHDIIIEEKPNIFDFQEAYYILDNIQEKNEAVKYKSVIKEFVRTNLSFLEKSGETWREEYKRVKDAKKLGVIFCFADDDYIGKIVDFFNEIEKIYEESCKKQRVQLYAKHKLQQLEHEVLNINFLNETGKLELTKLMEELPKLMKSYNRFKLSYK